MKNKKLKDNNIIEKNRKEYVYDEYIDLTNLKTKPASREWLEGLALRLMDWAINNDDALKITQFSLNEKIYHNDLVRWKEKHDFIAKAYSVAMLAIGNRRENGGIKKKYDSGMVSYTMAHYDKDWKELAEWKSKLNAKEEDKPQTKIVIIEKFTEETK